jgi:hypothetical protein
MFLSLISYCFKRRVTLCFFQHGKSVQNPFVGCLNEREVLTLQETHVVIAAIRRTW